VTEGGEKKGSLYEEECEAWSRSLVFDLSITHDRFGSNSHVQQNGSLSHPQDLDCPMRVAAQRKTNDYKQTYADNQNMSFSPPIMRTSNRMHGEFLRLLFLQAHRETESHFTAMECHCNTINRNHFGSSALHSTKA
jgi:hypothetical protein